MQNLKENIDKLNKYIKNKNYDDIDIVDLVKYLANKYGANLEIDTKKEKMLDEKISFSNKTVFLLVDGLGYYKVKELNDSYILKQNLECGIQTVNPTSTACVLSSIASACYPTEHGIFGWWGYLRDKNINYCPLPFVERKSGINLKEKNVNEDEIFRFDSILDKLNVKVNVTMPRQLINSDFSRKFIGKKASTHGFYSIKEGFSNLSKKIKKSKSSFSYMYIDGLDETSHIYGTKSVEVMNIINEIETGIKDLLNENEDVTMIITADHGQVDMEKMLYLNQNTDYNKYFYALPSIDTRMVSFYVKEELKEEFENTFINEFGKDVILLKTEEINKFNLFGKEKISEYALSNLGEYVCVVVNNKFMLCDKVNLEDKLNTKGNHSGLTPEETTIPLIVI